MAKRSFGEVWAKKRGDGREVWFVRYRLRGRRICRKAGRTRKEAEAYLAARMLEVHRADLDGREVTPATTLADIAPRILASWAARLRPLTSHPRRLILNRAAAHFGTLPMSAVRRTDVEAWLASRPALGGDAA